MNRFPTLDRDARLAKPVNAISRKTVGLPLIALAALAGLAPSAQAVDGCQVLLCLAAPSWRSITRCVPPVRQVLRDLAKGKAFPTCAMSGPNNNASHRWASVPDFCPPQYTRAIERANATTFVCDYAGAIAVEVEGSLWARTWWSFAGDTVTEFTPAAKARLGMWDTKFDDDYAAWLATQPPALPPCNDC